MDWSPQLWVACFDDDEQNARLASRAWEDNGLDIPENFLDTLLAFLGEPRNFIHSCSQLMTGSGHSNEYVRSSTARAIAGALDQHPQTILSTLSILENYYREKVPFSVDLFAFRTTAVFSRPKFWLQNLMNM
jgi:hypothetical protein